VNLKLTGICRFKKSQIHHKKEIRKNKKVEVTGLKSVNNP
jgi:hypothetical protein